MLKLTLRDMFWLLVVIGLALAWGVNRTQLLRENARLNQQLNAAAEKARVETHTWWIDAIKQLDDVDRLTLLAKLAAEQPRPDYEVLSAGP